VWPAADAHRKKSLSFEQVKTLLITIIALVIPVFFALIFASSTYSKLDMLRRRCREARERLDAAAENQRDSGGLQSGENTMGELSRDYAAAAENYESARKAFPASLVAAVFGFRSA